MKTNYEKDMEGTLKQISKELELHSLNQNTNSLLIRVKQVMCQRSVLRVALRTIASRVPSEDKYIQQVLDRTEL